MIANRFVAQINLEEEDFENAIKTSKRGLEILQQTEHDISKALEK